jgi:L-alanine-DL-glutamate epimerase-like enolase superfamily enzyme
MNRRQFLTLLAASALARYVPAAEVQTDVRISKITAFDLPTKRPKFIGKNARLDNHGDTSIDRVVILEGSDGTQGFGCCRADAKTLGNLLSKPPSTTGLGVHTMPVWDLLGKILKKPVYRLLNGNAQRSPIRVYDGSIYFSDLLSDYADRWPDRFRWEIDEILGRGHRAFKAKIGRGNKWMTREEGDARDIEVLRILREHAGKDVAIAVDANNGYDLPRTKRLLETLSDYNFAFMEEMFPEDVKTDLELKTFLRDHKLATLIADGETQPNVEPLRPMIEAKAIDLFQLDVNAVGIEGLMAEAALCKEHGSSICPHTWGTLLGFYVQLHVAVAIDNFYAGEQDPLSSDLVISDGYAIKDGMISISDSPGFGLKLDADKLSRIKPTLELRS